MTLPPIHYLSLGRLPLKHILEAMLDILVNFNLFLLFAVNLDRGVVRNLFQQMLPL